MHNKPIISNENKFLISWIAFALLTVNLICLYLLFPIYHTQTEPAIIINSTTFVGEEDNTIVASIPTVQEDNLSPTPIVQEDIVLGASTTTFQSYGRLYSNRARNIRLATRILNGTVIQPGQTFSFNEIVGPRDREHGFREAPTIIAGEMSESYGGGVCQVASTLFSAVLYSGLTIQQTRPHSHYMHYIDPGFDSTVFYEYVDFTFRNDFEFPVTIQSTVSPQNELTINILGREQVYSVIVDVHTLYRRRIETQRIRNSSLEPGHERIIDFGTSRMRVRRTVTYTPINIHSEYQNREWISMINYQPTPRVIEYN